MTEQAVSFADNLFWKAMSLFLLILALVSLTDGSHRPTAEEKEALAKARQEAEALRAEIVDREADVARLESRLGEERSGSMADNDAAQEKIKRLATELEDSRAHAHELEAALAQREDETGPMRARLVRLEEHRNALLAREKGIRDELEAKTAAIAKLEKDAAETQAARATIASLEEKLVIAEKQAAENSGTAQRQLESRVQEFQQQVARYQSRNEALKKEVAALREHNVRSDVDKDAALSAARERLQKLERSWAAMATTTRAAEQAVLDARREAQALRERIAAANAQIVDDAKTHAMIVAELNAEMKRLEAKAREAAPAPTIAPSAGDAERKIRSLQARVQALESEVQRLENERVGLQAQVERLRARGN